MKNVLLAFLTFALAGCVSLPSEPSAAVTAPISAAAGGISFTAIGKTVTVTAPIVVDGGKVIDGRLSDGKLTLYNPSGLGDGSQREGQKPIFIILDGEVRNVRIGRNADGIHLKPRAGKTATVRNVQALDVGEDMLTVDGPGKSVIVKPRGAQAADKCIQVNRAGTGWLRIEGALFEDCARCIRACGTCGDHPYRIEIVGGEAWDCGTVLKMSNDAAEARVTNFHSHGGRLLDLSNGAAAKISP